MAKKLINTNKNKNIVIKLNSITRLLNKELKISAIKDQSRNGLQVRASTNITKIGLAVDASIDSFREAKRMGCDLLIVHHGLMWEGQKDTANLIKKRTEFLKSNNLSLYAAHLPLDKNIEHGHNSYILKLLHANRIISFGNVGYIGYLKNPKTVKTLINEIERGLNTKCVLWRFGKEKVKKVAVVSGAGSSFILEAIKNKVDLFVTGEVFSWEYNNAKEGKLNVAIAGHYKTETSGVISLGELLKNKFGLKTVFIDMPNGL